MLKLNNDDALGLVQEELPWLIFMLRAQYYAVNSAYITSIGVLPEITPIPNMPHYVDGIATLREEVIPVVDLRTLFKLPTLTAEQNTFEDMIRGHLKAHESWFEQFKSQLNSGESITVQTNPNLCEFGKWLYSYIPRLQNVSVALNKIDEPHKELHQTAKTVIDLRGMGRAPDDRQIVDLISDLEEVTLPRVSEALQQAINVCYNQRHMLITLQIDEIHVGIRVDEVLSVESVNVADSDDREGCSVYRTKYVSGVGRCVRLKDLIGLINEHTLADLARQITISE